MKQMIYADNAATTRLDRQVFDAMTPWLLDHYGNPSVAYSFSRAERNAISESRAIIAQCIDAEAEEIFFTSGGTESDNWAVKGVVQYNTAITNAVSRSATITSQIEHHAVLHACQSLEKFGYPVTYLPAAKEGIVEPDTLEQKITSTTKLVSIMLANNEIGTVQPLKKLTEVTHRHGACCHTDAVQAAGHIPIDVKDLGVDLLSASAHKFYGPKGIGFLYIRKGTNILPYMDGGAQERGLRAGTENVAGIVGMAVALKKAVQQMQVQAQHLQSLTDEFYDVLNAAGLDYRINGDLQRRLPGNINISFKNNNGEALLHRLDLKGIYLATGSACTSGKNKPSHVIEAIKTPNEYAIGTLRISFGKYNTLDESIAIAKELVNIIGKC